MSLSFPTAPIVGQAYQNWVWNGASWDPNFAAQFVTSIDGASGALSSAVFMQPGNLVQIARQVVAAQVAAVVFTGITSVYDEYEIHIFGFRGATEGNPAMQISVDGGATWPSTAGDYYNASAGWGSDAVATNTANTGQSFIIFGGATQVIDPPGGACYRISFYNPTVAGVRKFFNWLGCGQSSTRFWSTSGAGMWWPTGQPAFNALRFIIGSGGNVAGGTFILYGVKR